jgi:hypothetical protein
MNKLNAFAHPTEHCVFPFDYKTKNCKQQEAALPQYLNALPNLADIDTVFFP